MSTESTKEYINQILDLIDEFLASKKPVSYKNQDFENRLIDLKEEEILLECMKEHGFDLFDEHPLKYYKAAILLYQKKQIPNFEECMLKLEDGKAEIIKLAFSGKINKIICRDLRNQLNGRPEPVNKGFSQSIGENASGVDMELQEVVELDEELEESKEQEQRVAEEVEMFSGSEANTHRGERAGSTGSGLPGLFLKKSLSTNDTATRNLAAGFGRRGSREEPVSGVEKKVVKDDSYLLI